MGQPRHVAVERGVEASHLRQVGEGARGRQDGLDLMGQVVRREMDQFLEFGDQRRCDAVRQREFCSAVDHPVTHRVEGLAWLRFL